MATKKNTPDYKQISKTVAVSAIGGAAYVGVKRLADPRLQNVPAWTVPAGSLVLGAVITGLTKPEAGAQDFAAGWIGAAAADWAEDNLHLIPTPNAANVPAQRAARGVALPPRVPMAATRSAPTPEAEATRIMAKKVEILNTQPAPEITPRGGLSNKANNNGATAMRNMALALLENRKQ